MADTTAKATERFGIPYTGRNQQNGYDTYESGQQAIDGLIFSTLETSSRIIKTNTSVIVEEDGGTWYFKQAGDVTLVSRTLQSDVIIQQSDLALVTHSIIGVVFVSGATTTQYVDWELYQSNVPVDADVITLGYVNGDYSISWFNGQTLPIDTWVPWLGYIPTPGTIDHDDLINVTSDQHHAQLHAASHTDGSDDIQDATTLQKGLMTAAYATIVEDAVVQSDFNTSTVLVADVDDTPTALTVGTDTVVGRRAGVIEAIPLDDLGIGAAPTTVSAATYSVSDNERVVLVAYTGTAPVTITLTDNWIANDKNEINIIDSGKNATLNNITIVTESAQTINGYSDAVINSDGTSLVFVTDGSNVFG